MAQRLIVLLGLLLSAATLSREHAGIQGTPNAKGCGDGLWKHVYKPQRLTMIRDCTTVTGVIVDVTSGPHGPDGLVHAADGDAKGWLKVDPPFASLLDSGNTTLQGGNLVFEVICRFEVEDPSASQACAGFRDHTIIPTVGAHVAVTGSLVRDTQPSGIQWNEIHPVSAIRVR